MRAWTSFLFGSPPRRACVVVVVVVVLVLLACAAHARVGAVISHRGFHYGAVLSFMLCRCAVSVCCVGVLCRRAVLSFFSIEMDVWSTFGVLFPLFFKTGCSYARAAPEERANTRDTFGKARKLDGNAPERRGSASNPAPKRPSSGGVGRPKHTRVRPLRKHPMDDLDVILRALAWSSALMPMPHTPLNAYAQWVVLDAWHAMLLSPIHVFRPQRTAPTLQST